MASRIENGTEDIGTPPIFPFVAHFVTPTLGSCSAVLITRRWAITANHCITGSTHLVVPATGASYEDYPVTFDFSPVIYSDGSDAPPPGAHLNHNFAESGPIIVNMTREVRDFSADDTGRDFALVHIDNPNNAFPLKINFKFPRPGGVFGVPGCLDSFDGNIVGYGTSGILGSDLCPPFCPPRTDAPNIRKFNFTGSWDRDGSPSGPLLIFRELLGRPDHVQGS